VPIAPRDFITFPPARCHQNQRAIHPGQFYEWVRANTPKSAGAILIGGNRFRAVGTIKALERGPCAAGIDSKPGWAWHALRTSGTRASIVDYGQIFARELRA
jgi:maleate cis-trans isomerase